MAAACDRRGHAFRASRRAAAAPSHPRIQPVQSRARHATPGVADGARSARVAPAAARGAMNSIDVVIPAFNAAPYIGEAIASVLAQSPAVSRVIVVDDGSTDATASVAEAFGTPVEVIRLGDNRGAGRARNAGIAGGTSALVAFLDADDRWLAGKLAAQCEVIDWFSRARVYPHVHVETIGVERRLHRTNTSRRAPAAQRDYLLAARRHIART